MEPDGGKQEVFVNTGGRVLGFDFDAGRRMIAADAMKGLLAIAPDGRVTLLAKGEQGRVRRRDRSAWIYASVDRDDSFVEAPIAVRLATAYRSAWSAEV